MRFLAVTTCALFATWGLIACSGQGGSPSKSTQDGGTSSNSSSSKGSSTGNGGSSSSASVKGGASSGGASSASGGTTSAQGGTSAATNNGGTSTAQGGSSNTSSVGTASAGAVSRGGTSATSGSSGPRGGGVAISGAGTTAGGGVSARGGASSAVGGTSARGGASPTGGATPTGGTTATGGTTGGGVTLPPITNGQNGTTTRYWDCCMPSCSWKANAGGKNPVKVCGKDGNSVVSEQNRNACDGGSGFMCYWGAPWSVSSTVSYGYAAYNGVACGTCFQIDFTDGAARGKSMIVQAINIGSIGSGQFDLLIPGGGVGAMNACNSNGNMWNGADLGSQYGGLLAACGGKCDCVKQKCQSLFSNNKPILDGCNWFTDWFQCADNPKIVYKQTSCPSDITNKSGISG